MEKPIAGGILTFLLVFVLMAAIDILPRLDLRPAGAPTGFTVVIDAGHGGKDRGASGPSGAFESDINLAIALFLKRELVVRGVNVVMTRETVDWLASPLAPNKKKDDMNNRRMIIERAQPNVVISIHLNTFPDPSVRGLQAFYNPANPMGRAFAQTIQAEFNNREHINRTAKPADFYILSKTRFPAVLVECGFLSNPQEEQMLQTTAYRRILAYYIATATFNVLTSGGTHG